MVEVKGPGDRLSTKQILWLDYFVAVGVSAEVCYVKGELFSFFVAINNPKIRITFTKTCIHYVLRQTEPLTKRSVSVPVRTYSIYAL